MPWGRLHDQANGNAKLLALSNAAWRLWGCGLIYSNANLTEGFIPEHAIPTFGVRVKNQADLKRAIDELCASLVPGKKSLWTRVTDGYQIHDFLDWNDSREAVLRERSRSKDRVERFRQRLAAQAGSAGHVTPLQTALPTPHETANDTRDERRSLSGSTTTKDQNQKDQRRSRSATRSRVPKNPDDAPQVLLVLAHAVLDDVDAGSLDALDVPGELKNRAAKANLLYDSERIRKALDSAERQRPRDGKRVAS